MKYPVVFAVIALLLITVSLPWLIGVKGSDEQAQVVSHKSFIEHGAFEIDGHYEGDFLHVIGVIQVTGTGNIKDVRVDLTFYDAAGDRITAGPVESLLGTYREVEGVKTPYNLLGPGDKLPFHVVLLDEAASAKVDAYDISLKYTTTEEQPYRNLVILNHRLRSFHGSTSVIGELTNTGQKNLHCVSVYVAFYDARGEIMGAEYYPIPLSVMIPGDKLVFATYSAMMDEDVSYELTPVCIEADYAPYREFRILSHSSRLDQYGDFLVEGEVANTGSKEATSVNVAVDFYDRFGIPLGANDAEIPSIQSGGSSPFSVRLWDIDLASEVANYTFHVSSGPYTTGAPPSHEEEPVRSPSSLPVASVAVAVGAGVSAGLTATAGATGLGQQFNAAVSRLDLPDSIKDFLKFYTEETFKHVTGKEAKVKRRKRYMSISRLLSLVISATALVVVLSYAELNGLSGFLNVSELMSVMPSVLITVVLFLVIKETVALIIGNMLNVLCELKVWLHGLVALLISGLGFLLPFGSPWRTNYEGDLDAKGAGLIGTLKILCDLALMIPFYGFTLLGYELTGDAGLLLSTMSAYYSSFPLRPLEGRAVFEYNKALWASLFAGSLALFVSCSAKLLPSTAYLLVGSLAAALFIGILILEKKRTSGRSAMEGTLAIPPPPPPPL